MVGLDEGVRSSPVLARNPREQAGPVLHPLEPGLHQRGQLAEVALGQVGQGPLEVRSHQLDRVASSPICAATGARTTRDRRFVLVSLPDRRRHGHLERCRGGAAHVVGYDWGAALDICLTGTRPGRSPAAGDPGHPVSLPGAPRSPAAGQASQPRPHSQREPVERRMRGDSQVRCGGRAGETGRRRLRNRAPVRPRPWRERCRRAA